MVKKEAKEIEEKISKLDEIAKKLAEKVEVKEKIDLDDLKKLKEEVGEKDEKKKKKKDGDALKETLVALNDYVKCGVHLGTKVITPNMREFVYRRRADGLAVLNTNIIDVKLREAIAFLNKYDAKDIFLTCKREAGWKAVEKFSEVTGIRIFTKKYPAGIITNTHLDTFFETELVIVCDPWIDKNAIQDAFKLKKPVIGLCDTNNYTKNITKVIPANNKSGKSIGLILYILARAYLESKGDKTELNMEDFTGEIEDISEDGQYVKENTAVKEGV